MVLVGISEVLAFLEAVAAVVSGAVETAEALVVAEQIPGSGLLVKNLPDFQRLPHLGARQLVHRR